MAAGRPWRSSLGSGGQARTSSSRITPRKPPTGCSRSPATWTWAGGTVARAYRELERDGLIVTRGRHGTFPPEAIYGARKRGGERGQRPSAGQQPQEWRKGGPGGPGSTVRRDQVPRIHLRPLVHSAEEAIGLGILQGHGPETAMTIPSQDLRRGPAAEAAVRVVEQHRPLVSCHRRKRRVCRRGRQAGTGWRSSRARIRARVHSTSAGQSMNRITTVAAQAE